MNYCIHLKKRKNKPYCNIIRKDIPFSRCQECGNKEYKPKDKRNSPYENKKCTEFKKNSASSYKALHNSLQNTAESNNSQIKKSPLLKEKSPVKSGTMKNKSKGLAKLERNRYSVFTDDLEHCILCGKKKNDLHEVFGGRNRLNSIRYNLVLPLCRECHSLNQNNSFFNDYWHRQGQEYFECNIGTREEFIAIFRRNYLE